MSSALAMVLMATMAVPGNGPEKVSGEMEQRLDLSGKWEGTYGSTNGKIWRARLESGVITLENNGDKAQLQIQIADEGHGKFRMRMGMGAIFWVYGNFKIEQNSVIMTFPPGPKGDQTILSLKRVNPGK